MTPWRARLPHGAGLPSLLLVLSLGIVVSCVSVTRSAEIASPGAPATMAGTFEPLEARVLPPSPSPTPSPAPTVRPTPTRQPTTRPTATPEPTLRPAALVPAAEPGAPTSPSAEPVTSASVVPEPSASPSPVPSASPSPAPSVSPSAEPAQSTNAGSDRPALDRATRRKVQRILRNTVKNKRVAGLQVAIRLPSGQTWLGTAGKAEFGPDRPIANDTVFSVASVTKTFVAALILQLAEEGALDLDVPYGTYFKDGPRHKTVTIRQLLSHTSGIYNYFAAKRYIDTSTAWLRIAPQGPDSRERRWTYEDIMDLVRGKGGYCKPGACYVYSNTNYVILGKIAEAVGGAPIHEQLTERFFEPLGLRHTYYQPAQVPPRDAAHGHWSSGGRNDHTRGSRVLPFMAAVTAADAAGAIASTARDLSVWADALYGGQVLSERSLRQMTHFLSPGLYGLGTDVASFFGNRGHGHRGGLRGFESSMWYFPADGVSIVLLSNEGNWTSDIPMSRIVKAVLGER